MEAGLLDWLSSFCFFICVFLVLLFFGFRLLTHLMRKWRTLQYLGPKEGVAIVRVTLLLEVRVHVTASVWKTHVLRNSESCWHLSKARWGRQN